ncbi:MAG: arginine--tRNA ligase [Thermodesulfobacteriota bacterium]
MKNEIYNIVKKSLDSISNADEIEFEIEIPKKKGFGDFSTNAALIAASKTGSKPREIAEKIVSEIRKMDMEIIERLEIAGPGFINFFLKDETFVNQLKNIYSAGDSFGSSNTGRDENVIVEFVSANPTGYLHFGHARNAAVGDSISRILSYCGFNVVKEFYINDAGMQMEMLGKSVFSRYLELFNIDSELPEDGYRGGYVIDIAKDILDKRKDELLKILKTDAEMFCRNFAYKFLLNEIKNDLKDLRVEFDSWYSEKEKIHAGNKLKEAEEKLESADSLEKKEGALWFKATEFGDTQDWVLIKSDGSPTYFISDIAYHDDKFKRGFKRLINIWGADHHSHFSRLKSSIKAIGYDESAVEVVLIQFVRLIEDGKEISMSKRSGSFITLREVLSEVGADVTRFFLLMRSSDSHLDFDLNLAKKESNENPVYYIQYVYARISSILKNAGENELKSSDKHIHNLSEEFEQDIIRKILSFPEVVKSACDLLSPHKIGYFLQDLASDFHLYYNKIKIINTDNIDLSSARLYLIICISIVIKNGLTLMGVDSPERM